MKLEWQPMETAPKDQFIVVTQRWSGIPQYIFTIVRWVGSAGDGKCGFYDAYALPHAPEEDLLGWIPLPKD